MGDKISISWDEVSSSEVDAKLKQQDVMQRVQEHQAQVQRNASVPGGSFAPPSQQTTGNVLQKPWAYLALFGLGFGFLGWMTSEVVMQINGQSSLWAILICMFVAIGLSTAESFMEQKYSQVVQRVCAAAILGVVGGFIGDFFAGRIFNFVLQGEKTIIKLFIARSLAWGIFGTFVAIAPGIMMRNLKKFYLGLIGGALGGLLGGLLFDPIAAITDSAVLSRMVGIISFGVLAGLAMGLLEEAAKQGWMRVVAGVIAGKQFILYKNPTVIGSSPKSEIYLFKDTSVMPIHAAIRQQGNTFYIENLDANGYTVVNGVPIVQQVLKNGDYINIGSTQFVFGVKDIPNR